jgi:UrcA family protein
MASHTHIAGDGDEHQLNFVNTGETMTTPASKLTAFRRSLAVAGALAALAVTTASFATAPSDEAPSVTVRYDDLNLATTAGANTLYHRISNAARSVCRDEYTRDLSVIAAMERCRANAIAQAVHEVNNPQLALVHAARVSHG